jgi:hypothetical protein
MDAGEVKVLNRPAGMSFDLIKILVAPRQS